MMKKIKSLIDRFTAFFNEATAKAAETVERSDGFIWLRRIICYRRPSVRFNKTTAPAGFWMTALLSALFPFLPDYMNVIFSVVICAIYFIFESNPDFSVYDMVIMVIIIFVAPVMAVLYLAEKHFVKKDVKKISEFYLISCTLGATFSILGANDGLYMLALPVAYDLFFTDKNVYLRAVYAICALLLIANMSVNWQWNGVFYLLLTITYIVLKTRSGSGKIFQAVMALSGLAAGGAAVGYILFIAIASGNLEKALKSS